MKTLVKKWFHGILMPRGKNFTNIANLEDGWSKVMINSTSKNISTIYKIVNSKQPTVILCHPYLSESRQFFLKQGHAGMYLDLGFNVVIFDFNGFGHSPFVNFEYGEDLDMVSKYFKALLPKSSFVCHGVSFGASQAIYYTSRYNHNINKIIIENCLDSNLTYYKKRNIKLYYLVRGLMMVIPVNKYHDYVKGANRITNVASALLIYNDEDDLTTIEMGNRIQKNLKMPSQMLICKGKHLEAYQNNKNNYTKNIKEFIFA